MNQGVPRQKDIKKRWIKNVWRVLLFLLVAGIIILLASHPEVSWGLIIPVAALWLICLVVLSLMNVILGYGGEGKYVDLWSIAHFLSGILFGLLGVPLFWATLLLVVWELVEIFGKIRENRMNAIIDILLGVWAWFIARVYYELKIIFF